MRVARTDVIAGLPADLARKVVRLFRGREVAAAAAEGVFDGTGIAAERAFADLEAAGYLEKTGTDQDGYDWWTTTIHGNALAMASFGRPISRRTADRLVSGLIERAHSYNADPGRLLFIHRLRLFGSYLDPSVDPVGDVDVELVYGRRNNDPRAAADYAAASGRTFSTYLEKLTWPVTELVQQLKNRSAFISITTEDVSLITDRTETIYLISEDASAVPLPDGARTMSHD